jgi:hypothetical protein
MRFFLDAFQASRGSNERGDVERAHCAASRARWARIEAKRSFLVKERAKRQRGAS